MSELPDVRKSVDNADKLTVELELPVAPVLLVVPPVVLVACASACAARCCAASCKAAIWLVLLESIFTMVFPDDVIPLSADACRNFNLPTTRTTRQSALSPVQPCRISPIRNCYKLKQVRDNPHRASPDHFSKLDFHRRAVLHDAGNDLSPGRFDANLLTGRSVIHGAAFRRYRKTRTAGHHVHALADHDSAMPLAIVTDPSQAVGAVTLSRLAAGLPLAATTSPLPRLVTDP